MSDIVTGPAASRPATSRSNTACPACGQKTRRVSPRTVFSLLRDAPPIAGLEGYRFCAGPSCEVVYVRPETGETIGKGRLRVPVFHKEADPDRLVCYCFQHSVRDVELDALADGGPRVADDIADKCRQGLDRCEVENPRGACCIGDVRRVAAEAATGTGHQTGDHEAGDEGESCAADGESCAADGDSCCAAPDSEAPISAARPRRGGSVAIGGAVIAAVLSSACCWLPLALVALGVSAGGVAGAFETYRPVFLVVTTGLLGAGFYFVYRKPRCEPGDACAAPDPRLRRVNKVMLWLATAFVAVFAMFPSYVGYLLGGGEPSPAAAEPMAEAEEKSAATPAAAGVVRSYAVVGMSCEGCTAQIRAALATIPGVASATVSYPKKLATVTYAPGRAPDDKAVLAALDELGYEAAPAPQTTP